MSDHVLLNVLNEFGERNQMQGLSGGMFCILLGRCGITVRMLLRCDKVYMVRSLVKNNK